jgi:hypothetical protein
MAKERTSVRMQAQIKTLSEQGHSIRRIARILRLSRRTVRKFLEPAPQPACEGGGWMETVDWVPAESRSTAPRLLEPPQLPARSTTCRELVLKRKVWWRQ